MQYDQNDRIQIQHIDNSKVIFYSAAVTWLKYYRYGVKLYSINQMNQSINHSINQFFSAYRILKYKKHKRQVSDKSQRGKYIYVNTYLMADIKI